MENSINPFDNDLKFDNTTGIGKVEVPSLIA